MKKNVCRFFVASTVLACAGAQADSVYKIQLPKSLSEKQDLMKELSKWDVLGVEFNKGTVSVRMPEHVKDLLSSHRSFQADSVDAEFGPLDAYLDPQEVLGFIDETAAKNPQHAKKLDLGLTFEGRPLRGLIISSNPDDTTKPVVLFNGMHHAREVMSVEVVVHLAQTLLENYGRDAEITDWMNSFRIVVVPQVNPDGNAKVHKGERWWRKNAHKDGLGFYGVDLNRNYPALWNYCNGSSSDRWSESYRGASAGSEPETQNMMNLVSQFKPIADISYHSYSELIIYPFGCENVPNSSRELFNSVATKMYADLENDQGRTRSYAVGTAPELLYSADGTDLDWHWQQHGVLAYTIEVNGDNQGFQPNYERWRNVTVKRQEGGWKALLRRMKGPGFTATLETPALSGKVTYKVYSQDATSLKWNEWADSRFIKPFSTRSESGLIYQILDPGFYKVRFYRGKKIVKEVPVQVGTSEMTDLGLLRL